MKKALLLLTLIIFFASSAFAVCDYRSFCEKNRYKPTSRLGTIISRDTGATLLSEKVAQARIRKELKTFTKQRLNVSVKSYSLQDLLRGRLQSIVITGKNLNVEGVYLSYLELRTVCDSNYIQIASKPIKFKENMIIHFSTVVSDKDLKKTMDSNGYLDKLNCVNVKGCGITFFKLSGAGVNIKNNKLNFKIKVTSELLLDKPLDIDLSSDLKVEDGRIVFTKIDLGKINSKVDLTKVGYRLNAMNPLTFTLNVFENENTKMCIKNVDVQGDKIIVNGNIFIPKTRD